MKRLLFLCLLFVTSGFNAQVSHKQSKPFKVEWKEELVLPGNDFIRSTSFVHLNELILFGVATDKGSVMFNIGHDARPQISYTVPLYLTALHVRQDDYFTKEHCNVKQRSFSNNVIQESCFKMQPDWPAGSSVSAFTDRFLYHAEWDSFLKFDLEGNLIFRKQIGKLVNSQFISVGGSYIYICSQISDPALGTRLMQYDTLGNQKWSVGVGFVTNILADEVGNCYVLSGLAQSHAVINKLDKEGKTLWSKEVPGQYILNAALFGDSLFLCGGRSMDISEDGYQPGAFSILSAASGEILYKQQFEMFHEGYWLEQFTHVATDGKDVYLGGKTDGQSKKHFLLKLSLEDNTTGLKDENINSTGYNIFPNPGGSKFTISCEANISNTVNVTVRNISGQVVYQKEITCNPDKSFTLDLGKQPAGNYVVEIGSGEEKVVKKIILE